MATRGDQRQGAHREAASRKDMPQSTPTSHDGVGANSSKGEVMYEKLFEPVTINKMVVPNRLVF